MNPRLVLLAALTAATVARANIGVGTTAPAVGLEVATTGSSSAILVPRDTTANRPTGTNGMLRYNTTTNAMEVFVNGGWMQLAVQAVGSTANVTASGPPPNANIYSYTASANYTPAYGAVANINNGVWPATGSSTYASATCVQIRDAGTAPQQIIVVDLGSVKTIGNVYSWQSGYYNMYLGIAFSLDGITYANSTTITSGPSDGYVTAALAPNVTARYVRLTNGYTAGGDMNIQMVCQFAVGP